MKKCLFLLLLLLPLAASAARPAKGISRSEMTGIISEFRRYDGVEVVRLGRLATSAVKGAIRLAGMGDPDIREALTLMKGLKSLTILQYEDCAPAVRERLNRRISRALDKGELLMEARDGDTAMQMFGIVDDETGTVRDFVIHAPANCALICLFGTLSVDALSKFAEQ
ncbi:MAG: DUF4252 domain-containing protein [Bacteroidales bacterium]|nr:DUF4252 domain-containing protein [Bacteroidales bacterium]